MTDKTDCSPFTGVLDGIHFVKNILAQTRFHSGGARQWLKETKGTNYCNIVKDTVSEIGLIGKDKV